MTNLGLYDYNMIFPAGTKVVTRVALKANQQERVAGMVGEIIKAPTDNSHRYLLRLSDGLEVALKRHEFAIHKHFQSLQQEQAILEEYYLEEYIMYQCVVGSKAYGLEHEGSDTDLRGIYLPPAHLHWSLYGVPEQLENKETDECYWELRKFLILALKANPNVLECLYTPIVKKATPLAQELLSIKEIFLSQLIYQTYSGYVMSQFKKLEQDLRNRGHIRWKHAMHLIRLLLSGLTLLKEGFLPVSVEEHREQLLMIRDGQQPWKEVNQWRLQLQKEFEEAFASTSLPERPDYEKVNQFLVKARREMV